MADLVICTIFKNEAEYLYEWLSYHAYLGVKHFYLYDNNTTDHSREIIASWPDQSRITVIDWPPHPGQNSAYQHLIETTSDPSAWCAFIDCDEFLCPQGGISLTAALDWFQARGDAFYVHWRMFGSSGQIEARPGLVAERFVHRSPDSFGPNQIGKSVVRLYSATIAASSHIVRSKGPMINDGGEVINQFGSGIHTHTSHRLIALNHYYTKSLVEWQRRRSYGRADKAPNDPDFRRMEEDFHRHDYNAVVDLTALRITQRMKPIYYPWRAKFAPTAAMTSVR